MSKLELSIAVCTYNRKEMLADCLQSLFSQSLDPQKYEILVIDNNSNDGTSNLIQQIQQQKKHRLRYFFEARQGISYARNCAVNFSDGRYLAYLDDDEQAPSDWAKIILDCFAKVRPKPDVIGGPAFPVYPQGKLFYFDDSLGTTSFLGTEPGHLDALTNQPEFGFGCGNCACDLKTLKYYDGFNPKLGRRGKKMFSGEETELFTRMHSRGVIFWYEPAMHIYHSLPRERTTLRFQFKKGIYEGMAYSFIKQYPLGIKYIIKISMIIASLPIRLLWFFVRYPHRISQLLAKKISKEGKHIGYFYQQLKNVLHKTKSPF